MGNLREIHPEPITSGETGQTSAEYALVLAIIVAFVISFAVLATGGIGGVLGAIGDVVADAF